MKPRPFGSDDSHVAGLAGQDRIDRVDASLPVHYGREEPEHTATAQNISEGGLFIHTNLVFPVGIDLVLRIEFPRRAVERKGQVTWAIHVPERQRHTMVCGMGVQFTDIDACWLTFFRNWKRSLERSTPGQGST